MVEPGRILSLTEFIPIRKQLKAEGRKLVFTNGVFDILHKGHVEYLMKARNLGDAMVVAVNADSSVRRIKGDKRPINPQGDRAYLLAGLRCVDYVVFFEEDTPAAVIDAIIPDYLVKGADWDISKVVGREVVEAHGGRVLTIELTPDRSTTNVIEKVIRVYTGE
ncbi:MAG: D-glycero-beta-D-manno-heptose 1-phosphate adenylyltransferase [Bacteroidetes bacterium]|nr:D-glycero-beta-D-manno-heptose 1-phosphate adenylyltransferase [Bacteroidota bacterium]